MCAISAIDIVPSLIERLQARAAAGEIRGEYRLADITGDPLPRCDAILCRDCLVHLSFSNIERAVANFRKSGAVWLIATTFPDWQINRDCEDGDWRALNFERAPFNWGPPVELLNENCTEAGGGWRDKSLGAWRLAEDLVELVIVMSAGRSPHTGSAIEYFTWLSAKLDSIEAMPSSRVSLFFRNAS